MKKSEESLLLELLEILIENGISRVTIEWAIPECWDSIKDKLGKPTILDAFLYYWKTEFQWCNENPAWAKSYTELEFRLINIILNAFPQTKDMDFPLPTILIPN